MLVLWTVLPVNRETREGQHQAMETHMFSNTVPCQGGEQRCGAGKRMKGSIMQRAGL